VPALLADFLNPRSSRLIGARAAPPKRRQRKSTLAARSRLRIGVKRGREIIAGEFRSA
jgi:hypothetical protein